MPPQKDVPAELMESLSAPLGDLIAAVGRGVADAQRAMDAATIASFRELYGDDETARSLRAIGYQPTWYRIPKVEAEITVSLSVAGKGADEARPAVGDGRLRLYATPVDATYTNRYEYDLRATSKLRFTIVPVPPTGAAADMKIMPEVANKPFGDAAKVLEERGIAYRHGGSEAPAPNVLVLKASHAAGEVVAPGAVVELRFA